MGLLAHLAESRPDFQRAQQAKDQVTDGESKDPTTMLRALEYTVVCGKRGARRSRNCTALAEYQFIGAIDLVTSRAAASESVSLAFCCL